MAEISPTENPFAASIPQLQQAITAAQREIEAAAHEQYPDLQRLMTEEATKDLELAQKRLQYAQEGKHPNIPVCELRIASVETKIAEKREEMKRNEATESQDLRELVAHELILDLQMLEKQLLAVQQELQLLR